MVFSTKEKGQPRLTLLVLGNGKAAEGGV